MDKQFPKEEIQIISKYTKDAYKSLIRKMQIKTTQFHFTPRKVAIMMKAGNSNFGEFAGKKAYGQY